MRKYRPYSDGIMKLENTFLDLKTLKRKLNNCGSAYIIGMFIFKWAIKLAGWSRYQQHHRYKIKQTVWTFEKNVGELTCRTNDNVSIVFGPIEQKQIAITPQTQRFFYCLSLARLFSLLFYCEFISFFQFLSVSVFRSTDQSMLLLLYFRKLN